jgi:hypothetical protein
LRSLPSLPLAESLTALCNVMSFVVDLLRDVGISNDFITHLYCFSFYTSLLWFFLCVCMIFFKDKILLYRQAGPELVILSPPPPGCWDYRCVPRVVLQ